MSYRIGQHPEPKPNRSGHKTSTPITLYIDNGSYFPFAIPCIYKFLDKPKEVKNKDVLSEFMSFNKIKQTPFRRYVNFENTQVIHILKEFTKTLLDGTIIKPELEVVFGNNISGISAETWINDFVLYITFHANSPECIKKNNEEDFTIRLKYPIINKSKTTLLRYESTVVCSGKLKIKHALI